MKVFETRARTQTELLRNMCINHHASSISSKDVGDVGTTMNAINYVSMSSWLAIHTLIYVTRCKHLR